jgi:tetratricopeptide (TPR) repeat protein
VKRTTLGALIGVVLLGASGGCTSVLQQAYDRHTAYHQTGDQEALREAATLYEEHTAACPAADSCQEALRLLGDARSALGLHEEAAAAYHAAVESDPSTEAAVSAARGYLFAIERWMEIPPEGLGLTRWSAGPALPDSAMPPGPGDRPQPLTPVEEMLIEAADLYLSLDMAYEERTALQYQAAFLLYQRRHYDEAARRWREMAQTDPGAAEAVSALRILLPTHDLRQAWGDLVRDGTFFANLAGLSLSDPERENLSTMIQEAREKAQ